jgi:hypothetical protein
MFMGPRNWFPGINSASLCSLAQQLHTDQLMAGQSTSFEQRSAIAGSLAEDKKEGGAGKDLFFAVRTFLQR